MAQKQQRRVLITGAGGAPGSNFIASLRLATEENWYIVGADVDKMHLELTQGVDAKYVLPRVSDPNYIETLNRLVKKERIEFIHCQPEPEVEFLSQHKDELDAKTLFPSPATLAITTNKDRLNMILNEVGVLVPEAYHLHDRESLEKALKLLLKRGDRVWLRATRGGGSRGSLPVNTMLQAEGWIDYWMKLKGLEYSDFMMSEFLPGKEFAFQSIWYDGKLVTSMVRERVEYLFGHLFPSGQSSSPSIAKTVHRDDVNELGTKAVLAADPHATGIFCVDIKENVDGKPCVTEINAGRFFTTSNNFSTAGLNMPYYYVLMGMDGIDAVPELPQYNGIPADWYWVRMIDMGYVLVKGDSWTSLTP